jgi:DnaJ-class molecular chaperone
MPGFQTQFQSSGGMPFHFSQFSDDDYDGGYGGPPFGAQFSNMGSKKRKSESMERELPCSLSELYHGTTKREKVVRTIAKENGQRIQSEKVFEIVVKPGWKNGTLITFHNEGDCSPGSLPGDVCFKISQIRHPYFIREGHDIVYHCKISLAQALTGVKLNLEDMVGKKHEILIREVISPNFEHRLKGCGMPKPKAPTTFGDLIIRFDIQFPKSVKDTDRPMLKQILAQQQY